MEARLFPLAKFSAPKASEAVIEVGIVKSDSANGLEGHDTLRVEGGEYDILDLTGVDVVVVDDELSTLLFFPDIFLKEFFNSTFRNLCTLERCLRIVSRVRVMMPQMIHLYVMFWCVSRCTRILYAFESTLAHTGHGVGTAFFPP